MSKQKQPRKLKAIRVREFKPVVLVDDVVADRVMEECSAMSAPEVVSDTPDAPPEVASAIPDVWLVHKATSPRSLVVRRESDNFLARCRVRDASKYRRNVPVDVVGSVAAGLYEGKPPVVKRVEVAS